MSEQTTPSSGGKTTRRKTHTKSAGPGAEPSSPTPSSAHQMLEAVAIMGAFVVLLTMVAGVGPNAGRIAVALMVGLLILQGITHVNPFVSFVSTHPLAPGDTTFTSKGVS